MQFVGKTHLIFEIDPANNNVRVKEAQVYFHAHRTKLSELQDRVNITKRQLVEIIASLEVAQPNNELRRANLVLAKVTLQRSEFFLKNEIIPRRKGREWRSINLQDWLTGPK